MDRGAVDRSPWDVEGQRSAYAAALAGGLEEMLRRLEAKREVRRVVLFGSYARGRRDLFTDLDLLVVMDSDEDFVARTASLHRELAPGVGVDVDLLVYTPREFERIRQRGFVRCAVETGKVLLAR